MAIKELTSWTKIGTSIKGAETMQEAIEEAGLDWEVSLQPLFALSPTCEQVQMKKNKAIFRSDRDTELGIVGNRFSPIQNRDAFNFFQPLLDTDSIDLGHAVEFNEGKSVAIFARLKQATKEVVPGDPVEGHIALINGHDGNLSLNILFTPLRLSCTNVLRPAISKAIASQQNKIIKIQHTGGAAAKLIEARALLNLQERQFNESIVTWKAMARKQINQEQFDDYVRDVFQLQDTQDLGRLKAYEPLLENFERGLGSDIQGVRGTVWGAYQSITQYATHQVSARGEDSYTQMKSRLNSLIVGNGSLLLKRAQEIAVKVAVF